MKVEANAKINLALDVVRRRADGYHDLRMIMLPLTLHDTLEVSVSDRDVLESDDPLMPLDESNLILRALRFMREHYGVSHAFHINVQKRIPMEAGLAGGSADAGAMIRAVHELCRIPVSLADIARKSKCVGADVPFCVLNAPCRVEGIGEKLRPIAVDCPFGILLVKPSQGVSTAKAYAMLDFEKVAHPDIDRVEACLRQNDYDTLCHSLGNTLEYSAFQITPAVRELKTALQQEGVDAVLMSGSGSAVFALSRDRSLLHYLRQKYARQGYFSALCAYKQS